jgi:hypothetical protein
VFNPTILEDMLRDTLTRSLLGLDVEVGEFVLLIAWPTDSVLIEVNTTEIWPFVDGSQLFVMHTVSVFERELVVYDACIAAAVSYSGKTRGRFL